MDIYQVARQLMEAMDSGQLPLVARYLDEYPNLKTLPFGTYGETLLHVAAGEGREDVLRLLLAREVPVNLVADGKTALHCAIRNAPFSTIELLLTAGADPNQRTSTGKSPLDLLALGRAAAGEDDEDLVANLLLSHGATR